jgi:hypothetical protein
MVMLATIQSRIKVLSSRLLSKSITIRIYKTIILPVFLYGCETWSLMLKEEHRMRVSENMVLRRIFGLKRDYKNSEGIQGLHMCVCVCVIGLHVKLHG